MVVVIKLKTMIGNHNDKSCIPMCFKYNTDLTHDPDQMSNTFCNFLQMLVLVMLMQSLLPKTTSPNIKKNPAKQKIQEECL